MAPYQWENTERVASAHRPGSMWRTLAQAACFLTPPVGWVVGFVYYGLLEISEVDIVLRDDGLIAEREHRGMRTGEFRVIDPEQ